MAPGWLGRVFIYEAPVGSVTFVQDESILFNEVYSQFDF